VHPIRIARHARGENKPAQDLYVSPAHAICIDVLGEVLIPACALVNGSTITQVDVDQITYWHIELDSHDILIANGLPAESYIDTGNRRFFVESDIVGFDTSPDADLTDPARRTHADFCRPFVMDGPILDAVRLQLRRRAETLGWTLDTSQPWGDLHLVVGNLRIDPVVRGLTARFTVPAGAGDGWLVSTSTRPCDVTGGGDRRHLGVCLAGLTIDEGFGERSVVALDDPLLGDGLYQIEDSRRRWTAGRALLPAALWDRCREEFFLLVDTACPALSRWTKPLEQTAPAREQMSAKLATSA
jgi:Hint domain